VVRLIDHDSLTMAGGRGPRHPEKASAKSDFKYHA